MITLLLAAGCAVNETGALMSVDYLAGTDVVGFHFEIDRVACDASDSFAPYHQEANVDLVDGLFPAMIGFVENNPFDADTRHTGADLFLSLDPGCYDILAAPASAVDGDDWTPSADCSVASSTGVEVVGTETAEVLLLSQCIGDETGALDTLVLLNHEPELSVDIDEKFNYECEPVNVCVTYSDPDDDPMDVDWESSPAWYAIEIGDAEVIDFDDGHRVWQQCADIVTLYVDSYDVTVTVRDLGYSGGSLMPIEDIIGEESNASLTFPIHTNWIEEPLCFDDDGTLVPVEGSSIERYPGCGYIDAETYYCSGAYAVDPDVVEHLCDGTDLIEENLYPNCDGSPDGEDPEIPCDGIDNDGDGVTDEGSEYGTLYTYNGPSGGVGGVGQVTATDATYDTVTEQFTYEARVLKNGSYTANFLEAILSSGGVPSYGMSPVFYMDGSGAEPVLTIYAYRGASIFTDWQYGTPGGGAPDQILSSLDDDSFINSFSITDDGTAVTFSLDMDASGLNDHSPLHPHPSYGWNGAAFDGTIGIWSWAAYAALGYSGDYVNSFSYWAYTGYDIHYGTTSSETVCH